VVLWICARLHFSLVSKEGYIIDTSIEYLWLHTSLYVVASVTSGSDHMCVQYVFFVLLIGD
jgi:hypothetical protein